MREPRWVPRIVVDAVHLDLIREHGGMPGLRDEDGLESALARPRNLLAYEPQSDVAALAAAYGWGIARNHPYHDGNKRIAFLAVAMFLGLNGRRLTATEEEVVAVMLELASGALEEASLADWIRVHSAKR